MKIQGLSKMAGTGNQGYIIASLPPLFDEMRFIDIEIMIGEQFFETLNPYSDSPRHKIPPVQCKTFSLVLLYRGLGKMTRVFYKF